MRKWGRELGQWDWEQEYPKMPETFHKALLKEVERHCSREELEQILMAEQSDWGKEPEKDLQREWQTGRERGY